MRTNSLWLDPPTLDPDPPLAAEVGPLLAQILTQRGINTLEAAHAFLDPAHYTPTQPTALPDLEHAAALLSAAIRSNSPILVWGDFDADGQTSTALLVDALQHLGARVCFYIPHRLRESHGIRLASLQDQIALDPPTLLLTCDTGVSELESIDYAKSKGLQVVITDHHDLPPTLPTADAIINPKRLPAHHPLRTLPGVGVAYKLIEHLFTQHGQADHLPAFLDLVALGIVADVAELTGDTRYLLQTGLECLRNTQRLGLRALTDVAALNTLNLTATDIGFQLGPRLNAAGRLDDARPVVELLTTTDPGRAHLLAAHLEGLNAQRRLQNRQILAAAQEQIANDPSLLDWEALVLSNPNWHAGIIGIVASRLADQYQRPVVLLTTSEDGTVRGSARSAPGYDIGAAIAAQSDLLLHYGGHPGAAGLSLREEYLPAFRRRLSNTLRETKDTSVLPGLTLDAYVSLRDITPALAADLNRLAPFGEGNPRIHLATTDLTLKSAAHIGHAQQHRRLTVQDFSGNRATLMWWNSGDKPLPEGLFDIAYELEISAAGNDFQLLLLDYRRAASAPVEIIRPPRQIIDLRLSPDADLSPYPNAAVWAEGYRLAESPGQILTALAPSDTLIIYTAPAAPETLQEALERVNPVQVVLLGINPPQMSLAAVQRRFLELSKFVLDRQQGITTLEALASATAQSRSTIRHLLDYYAARGEITVTDSADHLLLASGAGIPHPDEPEHAANLRASVAETLAYRAYFHRAQPHAILGWDQP